MSGLQPVGWQNPRAYPLLISQEAEWALGKFMSDKRISKGKAINKLLVDQLVALGYIAKSTLCKHPETELKNTPAGYGPYYFCKICEVRLG